MSHRRLPSLPSVIAITAVALSLAGCSVEDSALTSAIPTQVALSAIQGKVMGGETPIRAANVILWQTSSGGYGSTSAVQLATTTTGLNGAFSFTTGYTCNSSQYVYITSTGGDVADNPTSPTINDNVVLMAALGSCANFANSTAQGKVNILVNELTTVAAAYALNGFISINENSGSPGNQLVYVGAPANNNASTGSCSGVGTLMTCTAAGLAHAFANALNLVDAVHYDGSQPTGAAFTTIPGSAAGAATTVPANSLGSVPQALINSLGDIMQYCTNSSGGTAGDGSNCGNFFADATPAVGSAPADTLSAIIDVAQNPRNNVGSTCTGLTGGLFCLIPSSGAAFTPSLTAVPHDWTLAIVYTGLSNLSSNNTFTVPYYLTLDANDNVYVLNANAFTPTSANLAEMTSAGTGLWANAANTGLCEPGTVAVDNNGFVWTAVDSTSSNPCAYAIYGYYTAAGATAYSATAGSLFYNFQPASGTVCGQSSPSSSNCPGFVAYDTTHAIQSTPNALAFDRLGNLWYGRKSSSCTQCLLELPFTAGSSGTSGTFAGPTNIQNSAVDENQILIDPTMNVWVSNVVTSGDGTLYVLPNTSPGTPNTPSYAATPGYYTATLPASSNGGLALDSSGNVWAGSADNVSEFTPTTSSGVITGFGTATNVSTAASKPYPGEVDGNGIYWYGSYTSSGDIYYQITPSSSLYSSSTPAHNTNDIQPCYLPAGASTCSTTVASGDPRVVQVDSTGALWVASQQSSSNNQGFVLQILGAASPTWPQLSYGVFGAKPQ